MSSSMSITVGVAKVILAIIGRTHEEVVALGWPRSYELYCPSFFDVKLSYDPHDGYYIKSYPAEPEQNMKHFLRFFNLYSKYKRGAEGYIPEPWFTTGIKCTMYDKNLEESIYQYCKQNQTITGRWLTKL